MRNASTNTHHSSNDPPPYTPLSSNPLNDPPLSTAQPFNSSGISPQPFDSASDSPHDTVEYVQRTLHVYKDGLTRQHITVKDSDKSTSLYTVVTRPDGLYNGKICVCRSLPFAGTYDQTEFPAGSHVGHLDYALKSFDGKELYLLKLSVNDRRFFMDRVAREWEFLFELERWGSAVRWRYSYGRRHGINPVLLCVAERTGKWLAKLKLSELGNLLPKAEMGTLVLFRSEMDPYMMDELVASGLLMLQLHFCPDPKPW